jgi:hypothetical protein
MNRRPAAALALLLLALPLQAELAFRGHPASLSDHDGLRLNPALAAWQPLAWEVDWSWMHTGLLASPAAIGQGGFTLSLPRVNAALLASHRDTDLLGESELALDWGFRPLANLSLGIEVGLRRFGWNRERLDPVQAGDPVFDGGYDRIEPILGGGLFWAPRPGLRLGLGLKHLNRPSLSLSGDGPRAPVRVHAGLLWQGERLALGLSGDNLDYVRGDGTLLDELGGDWSATIGAAWSMREDLRMEGHLREDGLRLGLAASWLLGHWLRYEFTLPLGELADAFDGSHRLAYRFNLGGELVPRAGADGRVIALAERRMTTGSFLDIFARLRRPERAPVLLRPRTATVEALELHLRLDDELAARLEELELDPGRLAAAGVNTRGPRLLPDGEGLVRDTYSQAWWRLAARIESLAWEQGLSPVIHSGGRELRLEELARLTGAPLTLAGDGGRGALPEGELLRPDTLRVDCLLPGALAARTQAWHLRLTDAAGTRRESAGRGAPPALLVLPLAGDTPLEAGEARLELLLEDDDGRELLRRTQPLGVQRRVRHATLRLMDQDAPLPERIDGLHLHLGDEQ